MEEKEVYSCLRLQMEEKEVYSCMGPQIGKKRLDKFCASSFVETFESINPGKWG